MEERGPIQVAPRGLLGLLQLKADGRAVSKLGDTCVPSLEMVGWWLRANAELWALNSGVTDPAGAYGTFREYSPNGIQVPNGEWWFVHDYAVQFSLVAANQVKNLRLAWASTPAGTIRFTILADPADMQPVGAIAGAQIWCLVATEFWLPPGARLGYTCESVTGATGLSSNVTQLRYTRLPV